MANNSYDFALAKRDVQEVFDLLVASKPNLLSLIRKGANATATKVEWLEDTLAPLSTGITSFGTDGDGTVINVTSTSGMVAGQLIRFESSTGADRGEIAQIASVGSSTQITITRDYGSSTGATLVSTDTIYRVSTPKNEATSGVAGAEREPTSNYNYTQIFDRTAKLSKTAIATGQYGGANTMAYQLSREMMDINYEINSALIYGERVERTSSAQGSFGGILSFLRNGNIDTTGSAISATIINNMFKAMFDDGAGLGDYVILCNANQARKLSAFNTAGTNPVVNVPYGTTQTGGAISTFISDLPSMNGFTARIVVEPSFPKDKLALLDLNNIELAYLRPFTTTPASIESDDYIAQRVLGELTCRIKNGTKAHALATGLTI